MHISQSTGYRSIPKPGYRSTVGSETPFMVRLPDDGRRTVGTFGSFASSGGRCQTVAINHIPTCTAFGVVVKFVRRKHVL